MIEFLLLVLFLSTSASTYVFAKKCLSLSEKLEEVEEQVSQSLDLLDDCYARIDQKSKLEVMSDDPVIRDLVNDMRDAREAVLLVAVKINGDYEEKEISEKT